MQRMYGYSRILSTGAPAPLALITVYLKGTLTPATIYADNLDPPTALGNPFTADASGFWFFYAPDGLYDIRQSGGGIVSPFTWGDQRLDTGPIIDAVVDWGVPNDGVTDAAPAIAAMIAALPTLLTENQSTLYFRPGVYMTDSATDPVMRLAGFGASQLGLRIQGAGIGLTTFKQFGAANVLEFDACSNVWLEAFSIEGNETANVGIDCNNVGDFRFDQINYYACRGHSLDLRGLSTLHTQIYGGRMTGSNNPIAGARLINARIGNVLRIENVYFNGRGNASTGGSGSDTSVDVRGCDSVRIQACIFDGAQYGIRCDGAIEVDGTTYFDYTTPAPGALTHGIWQTGNNATNIGGLRGGTLEQNFAVIENLDPHIFGVPVINDSPRGMGFGGGDLVGSIRPATLTATVTDYLPVDEARPTLTGRFIGTWKLRTDGGAYNVSSVSVGGGAGADGTRLRLINTNSLASGFPAIGIPHEGGGTAEYRIVTPTGATVGMGSGACVDLEYDGTALRWRVVGGTY